MLVSIKTNMAYVFIAAGILLLYVATAKGMTVKRN